MTKTKTTIADTGKTTYTYRVVVEPDEDAWHAGAPRCRATVPRPGAGRAPRRSGTSGKSSRWSPPSSSKMARLLSGERPDTITFRVRGTQGTIHADLFTNLVVWQHPFAGPRAPARGLSGPDLTWPHLSKVSAAGLITRNSMNLRGQFAPQSGGKTSGLNEAISRPA